MKILILILLWGFTAEAQLVSVIVRSDTVFSYNPSTQAEVQLTKFIPSMVGQSGKVLSNNGTVYQWITNSASVAWGGVTGTLSDQTDLQSAINLKANLASPTFTGTPVVPGYLPNTATAGVANCPTASGTQTITHNLGRTPVIIDISAVGRFTSNAAATPTPFSNGGWTSSGNSCIYMTTAGTTTQDGLSSSSFAVFIATSSGNNISGVVQNVGATTFDIQWTETGTAAALPFRWKAQ